MIKHLKDYSHVYAAILIAVFLAIVGVGIACQEAGLSLRFEKQAPATAVKAPDKPSPAWSVNEPSQAAEFISGPVAASVGELCVFRLNDPATRADWIIVPEATCYVDSSGSSLAFASNTPAKYTVIAAIVEEGQPKLLQHLCDYGESPDPSPNPDPTPGPKPDPQPEPSTLAEWIRQNVPDAGKGQCAALATCYDATADAIEKETIQTQAAAFATLRTATQTKIKIDVWSEFLDGLANKVTDKLGGKTDVGDLVPIFREIAVALRKSQEAGDWRPEEFPNSRLRTNNQTRLMSGKSLKPPAYNLQPRKM